MTIAKLRKKVGSLFVIEPNEVRFWRAVDKTGDCWIWKGAIHYKGYGEFMKRLPSGNLKKMKAHRMSWELTNGEITPDLMICHKCDNRPCVNPSHLFIGTAKSNKEDCINKMRHAFGEKTGRSKLKEVDVLEIRKLDESGMLRIHIGLKFGISGRQVTSICRRESWKHLP